MPSHEKQEAQKHRLVRNTLQCSTQHDRMNRLRGAPEKFQLGMGQEAALLMRRTVLGMPPSDTAVWFIPCQLVNSDPSLANTTVSARNTNTVNVICILRCAVGVIPAAMNSAVSKVSAGLSAFQSSSCTTSSRLTSSARPVHTISPIIVSACETVAAFAMTASRIRFAIRDSKIILTLHFFQNSRDLTHQMLRPVHLLIVEKRSGGILRDDSRCHPLGGQTTHLLQHAADGPGIALRRSLV